MYHLTSAWLILITVASLAVEDALGDYYRDQSTWWSSSDGYRCPRLGDPRNGYVSVQGDTASYSCHSYYTLVGERHRVCYRGRWLSTAPECVADGQWGSWSYWTQCSRSCGTGWKTRQRSCRLSDYGGRGCVGEARERWKCTKAPCPECPSLANVTLGPLFASVRTFYSRLVASLTCAPGYKLVGHDGSEIDCWGDVIDTNPRCRRVCPDLPAPANGTVRIFDDIAAYTCNPGFRRVGSARRRCTDGSWTGTEPNCTRELTEDGIQRGINPEFLFSSGSNEMSGPTLLLPQCRVTVSFRYQVLSRRNSINLKAQLIDTRSNNTAVASASTTLQTTTTETQLGCFTLDCRNESLAIVGRVLIYIPLNEDELLGISNVQFSRDTPCQMRFSSGSCPSPDSLPSDNNTRCEASCLTDGNCESGSKRCCFNGCGLSCESPVSNSHANNGCKRRPCQNGGTCREVYSSGYVCDCRYGYVGVNCENSIYPGRRRRSPSGTPMGDCDNSTASSDCDYRNSGCSTEPWEMTIVDVDNEEDDDELTELTYEETTQDCHYHTCISCLQPSGFSTNSTEPTDPEPTKRRRRRREISSHGKAFCLRGGKKAANIGEYFIPDIDMEVEDTELISFSYNMRIKGKHHLILYLKCKGDASHIHVGKFQTVFGISHFDKTVPETGRACISLHSSIKEFHGVSKPDCKQFEIYIQAAGLYTKVCLEDFRFHSLEDKPKQFCRKPVLSLFQIARPYVTVLLAVASISNVALTR